MESTPENSRPRVVRTISLPQSEFERAISCPVNLQIFHTPVLLIGTGYTYERDVILKLLEESENPICPITKKPFSAFEINRSMMDLVEQYLAVFPTPK